MQSILAYVRSLIGIREDTPAVRNSFKRDRLDDDILCDDEPPAFKRLKKIQRTNYPDIMSSNDTWEQSKSKNVRYVPIQIEKGHPSTSTPNDCNRLVNRTRTIPVKLVDIVENGPSTPIRKPRMHTPVKPVVHTVVEDDDDPEEVTWITSKDKKSMRKPSHVLIDLNDEENENEDDDDDVIFVKKVTAPTPAKPYKFFLTKNDRSAYSSDNESQKYFRLKKLSDTTNISPKTYSKFKAPSGITKTYKKVSTPVPQWLQQAGKPNHQNQKNRFSNLNGNVRSTLSEIFNLDEKRNYQELIRRVAGTTRPVSKGRPIDIINLAEESASFRNTVRAQKKALEDIKFVEKGLKLEKESEFTQEYDPVTVASINSSDSEVEIVPSESSSSSTKIDPINTLRESFRDKPVTAVDWLAKLDSKYRKKRQDMQAKLLEARRESDIISKVNSEQKIAHLEHKLKYELSIPESLIEESEPSVELPELTPEQEKIVNRALGPGPPGQVLIEKFNLKICRRDLQTLCGLNWLNDEVINFYMNLLIQRSEERKDLPKVYATNTFFYPKLMQCGQSGLRRWTRKVDIFEHELMVVPVHLGVHWCMSLIDFREKKISYLDSMGGPNQACLSALLQYLKDEHQDKKGQPFDDSGWTTECLKDIPQQMNGSDCGMFACTFAEFSARKAPYTFTQTHMPYLRRKAALEILLGKLLL